MLSAMIRAVNTGVLLTVLIRFSIPWIKCSFFSSISEPIPDTQDTAISLSSLNEVNMSVSDISSISTPGRIPLIPYSNKSPDTKRLPLGSRVPRNNSILPFCSLRRANATMEHSSCSAVYSIAILSAKNTPRS